MKQTSKGHAVFYTRDSGGKHETTPAEYVAWAQREAERLGLDFDGTPERINDMIRNGGAVEGDLFLDFGVQGHILSRKGLDAMIERATQDERVTHILIPRRDRLARPHDPMDGIKLENGLRQAGLTIVFMDKTMSPIQKGKRLNIADLIVAAVDYDRSGQDRRDLAQKIIYAQIRLAKTGFSTGGRPPFGFRRWLARDDGTPVRELEEGEYVRRSAHHVVWLPGPEEDFALIRRILEMLETMPASQVAAQLTSEGIPSPDAGRYRTDNGVKHRVSGVWHQSMIVNIARNPLLLAVSCYGRRSMGDQLRFTPNGPRELEDTDFLPDDKPKTIRNDPSKHINAQAKFEPLVDAHRHQELLRSLDNRAGTQRGKPRSRDPDQNPLGCRVFDMNCGWPMYRVKYGPAFRYTCGLYQQSHAQKCAHNHVNGPLLTRFALSCIQQRLLKPGLLRKFERRIQQLADRDRSNGRNANELQEKQRELARVLHESETIERNLSRAKTDEQFHAISLEFDRIHERQEQLKSAIASLEAERAATDNLQAEIERSMDLFRRLTELAASADSHATARKVIELTNTRMFLEFHPVKVQKRTLNKVKGGVVTFGSAKPPIEVYDGRTSSIEIKTPVASESTGADRKCSPSGRKNNGTGREDKSLRNVSRGERI